MGCCGCGRRVTSIFAAIFSLIQACGWIGIAIFALQVYSCDITPNLAGSELGEAAILIFYLVYFFNHDCIETDITINLPGGSSVILKPGLNAAPTERTQVWMVTYVALSSLWIVTSVMLLVGAVGNTRGKCGAVMYYPWVLVTGAIIVCDVVAAVTYFMDITSTMGLPDLLVFIGVTPPASWTPDPSVTDLITAVPSIVMGLLFSRFVVIWIINTALFIYVILAAVAASKTVSQPTNWKRLSKQELTRPSDQTPWLITRPEESPGNYPHSTLDQRYPTPTYQQEAPHNPYQPYRHPDQPFSYAEQPPMSPPHSLPPRSSTQDLFQQEPQKSALQQASEQRYAIKAMQSNQPEPQKSTLQQASEQRYALKAMQTNKYFGHQQPSGSLNRSESFDRRAAPEELRSQLPWSYFQSGDELPLRLQNTQEEEESPPIPPPDYTLHFPKRQRPDNILPERESPDHGAPLRPTQPDRSSFTATGRYGDRY